MTTMTLAKSAALTIALYSLATYGARVAAFTPPTIVARSRSALSPTAITSLVVFSTTATTTTITAASLSTTTDDANTSEPHLITRPLPPIASLTSPSLLQKLRLHFGLGKQLRERVVHKYFHGVDIKNIHQITECFDPQHGAIIRDVCALTNRDVPYEDVGKLVSAEFLGERCNEFLEAHPDAKVMFHYGPTCGRGRNNNWVYAHWYEEGSWSGPSQGIKPDGSPLTVQGQTRFLVGNDLKIKEIVITRTFSNWEETLLKKSQQKEEGEEEKKES